MIIELNPGTVLSLIGLIFSFIALFYAKVGDARYLESRLTSLETKIEPLWNVITTELPGLLIRDTTPELDKLLIKLTSPNDTLNDIEKTSLLSLLDTEYDIAVKEENTGHGVAIVFLRARIRSG